jgi:hypothetical protein
VCEERERRERERREREREETAPDDGVEAGCFEFETPVAPGRGG